MVPAWTSRELTVRPVRTGSSPPWWNQALGSKLWLYWLNQSRSFSSRCYCQYLPENKNTGQRHVLHGPVLCFFKGWVRGIPVVRLFVIPSGAARSPNHDSAPQGSARTPPPPGSAPAPAPALAPARTVLIQGWALHIFSAWLGPSPAPDRSR